jgi:hypothetical protein
MTIEAGYYEAKAVPTTDEAGNIKVVHFGLSSTNTKQVLITFEIERGDAKGQKVPWFGYFTDKSWERTIQSLRYMGFKGNDLSTLDAQTLDQIVSLSVEESEWDGKTHMRVSWVNELGGGGVKLANPMAANDLRHFAAQMKGRVGGIPESTAPTNNAANDPAPGAPLDDDIPF